MIPRKFQDEVVRLVHCQSGHARVERTYLSMSSCVYFKSMYEQTRKMVTQCRECLLANRTRPARLPMSHKIPCSPGECIYIDVLSLAPVVDPVTGLTVTNLMLCVDDLTSYVVAITMTGLTAHESGIVLERYWYSIFGIPRLLISDLAPNYTGKIFENLLQRHGIVHQTSPSRHYMGHGKVEQKCKLVATTLRRMLENDQDQWLNKLPDALLQINMTCNSISGLSPYEAFLGRPAITPVTLTLPDQAVVREMADTTFKQRGNAQIALIITIIKH